MAKSVVMVGDLVRIERREYGLWRVMSWDISGKFNGITAPTGCWRLMAVDVEAHAAFGGINIIGRYQAHVTRDPEAMLLAAVRGRRRLVRP